MASAHADKLPAVAASPSQITQPPLRFEWCKHCGLSVAQTRHGVWTHKGREACGESPEGYHFPRSGGGPTRR